MAPDAALERTVGKILDETADRITSKLQETLDDSDRALEDSATSLNREYDRIIADGKKEAEKIQRQLVGSADLDARNKQLVTIEESVDKAFTKAVDQIKNTQRNDEYAKLMDALVGESTRILGTSEIVVSCNEQDAGVVQAVLPRFPGAELSSDAIECMGGIRAGSKDGSMTFDNTLDARLDRLKPLIRKEIASKFGLGS